MSDRQIFRVRRLGWGNQFDAGPAAVLVTDTPDRYPVRVSGTHSGQIEQLSATPDEMERWQAAGVAYLDAVAVAREELRLVRQRWKRWRPATRLPALGGWVGGKIGEAEQRYLLRVREAVQSYQPVLRLVEQRLAETQAEQQAEARRRWESQQAAQRAAEARFAAQWADWEREPQARAGQIQRNVQARNEAVAAIVAAIKRAQAALETAGRPGVQVLSGSVGSISAVQGWQITFRWPDSPVPVPTLRAPEPVCHCQRPSGWFYGAFGESRYLPQVVLAAGTGTGEARDLPAYRLARKRQQGWTDYDRHKWKWELASPAEFAEELLKDRISWGCLCTAKAPPFQLTEHADADQYVPYVRQLAQVVADGFGQVVTDELDAMHRVQQNLRARDDAKRRIVQVIEQAWQALQAAGRPGIGPVPPDPPRSQELLGWRVDLDWALRDEPHPQIPYVVLTENGAIGEPERFTYHAWQLVSAAEFADRIISDRVSWQTYDATQRPVHLAEHADPAEYLPYVQAVTEVVTAGFAALLPAGRAETSSENQENKPS